MFILNGKKFAKNDKEFTNSLFEAGGTCVGYYKKTSSGVVLMDMQKTVIGYCKSDNRFTGLVSASKDQSTGRIRYMFAACSSLESLVCFDNLKYSEQNEAVRQAIKALG